MKESGCDIVHTCAALEKRILKNATKCETQKYVCIQYVIFHLYTSIYMFLIRCTHYQPSFLRDSKIAVRKINFQRRKKRLTSDFEFNELLTHLT